MNTARLYMDAEGNDRTIHQMVKYEPDWAVSRIQQAERYEALLIQWFEQQKGRGVSDGNAPGHGHPIPGIWDTDNGPIAGHACAECALWAMATSLATSPTEEPAAPCQPTTEVG